MEYTKAEAAGLLAQNGIELPENWSKLSTARAVTWATNEVGARQFLAAAEPAAAAPKKTAVVAATAGMAKVSAGILSLGAAIGGVIKAASEFLGVAEENISVHIKKTAVPGEVYYNPKWKRVGPGKSRGWYPARRIAADPVPMTRQVARRKALNAGWPASEFRQFGEFAA